MRIDLHVHTRERSACAWSSAEEMISAAIDRGLDGLVITDHDRLVPADLISWLDAKYAPFRVYGGIEVTTREGHVLVLGIEDEELTARPRLQRRWWSYTELHGFVKERGGFSALAHPFRFNRAELGVDLGRYPAHALEVHSHNTPARASAAIEDVAARLNLHLLSNSDAHHWSELGRYYNVLEREPQDVQELAMLLKAGLFSIVAPHDGPPATGYYGRSQPGRSEAGRA